MIHELVPALAVLALACTPGGGKLAPEDSGTAPTDPTDTVPPTTDTTTPTPTTPTTPAVLPEITGVTTAPHPVVPAMIYVDWEQSTAATVHLEFSFDDGEWWSSPARDLDAGAHEELMVGLPYGSTVTWRIVAENAAGSVATPDDELQIEDAPSTVPDASVTISDPDAYDPETRWLYLSVTQTGGSFGDEWVVMIVDRRGRPVWAVMSDSQRMSMHPRVSWDGTALLIDQNNYWSEFFDQGAKGAVESVRLDGTPVHTWETPGLHHDYTDLPDGSLAWGGWTGWYSEALQRVYADGSSETVWDCDDWLNEIGVNDYCASNTLTYVEATDTFLYSFFSFNSIVEIDATGGEALRWFGQIDGAWDFSPGNSGFWYQHGGYITDTGTLLVSSHLGASTDEIVVREYAFDDANEQLDEVWSFGVGSGLTGSDMGEPHRLGNGNTLHNMGTNPRIREATPDGDVVWDISWSTETLGRSTPLSDLYVLLPDRP